MSAGNTRLVYSTDRAVPGNEALSERDPVDQRPGRQRVIVRLDRKGRGGKSVTVVEGLPMQRQEKETLLKRLKSSIGTGGTIKDNALEIQGDHCGAIMKALEMLGYRPKRSGG